MLIIKKTKQMNKKQLKSSPCPSKHMETSEGKTLGQVVLAKPATVLRVLQISISLGHNRPSTRSGSAPQLHAKPWPSYFLSQGFNRATSLMTSIILITLKPRTIINILQWRKRKCLDEMLFKSYPIIHKHLWLRP